MRNNIPINTPSACCGVVYYQDCFNVLHEGGIVIAQSESPLMDMEILVNLRSEMQKADYTEIQTIQFPVATYPFGWWTAAQTRKGQISGDFAYMEVGGRKRMEQVFDGEQMARHKPFETKL